MTKKQLKQMIIEAYQHSKQPIMGCPWCGCKIGTPEQHLHGCLWVAFRDEYITKLKKKNKPAPEWYNEDWSDK